MKIMRMFGRRSMLYAGITIVILGVVAACSLATMNRPLTATVLPSVTLGKPAATPSWTTVAEVPDATIPPSIATQQSQRNARVSTSPPATPMVSLTATPSHTPIASVFHSLSSGQYIVYVDGDDHLHVISTDGSLKGDLPDMIQGMSSMLSPDQNRIVFTVGDSRTSPRQTELYLYDVERAEVSVVPGGEQCLGGAWAPDGKHLVISCQDLKGQDEIYWLSLDGKEKVQLSDCAHSPKGTIMGGYCMPASISPDGKWIAYNYTVCDPNPDHVPLDGLYLMSADCIRDPSTCKTLSPPRLDPLRPCAGGLYSRTWSPDGRYLAVVPPFSEQYGNGIRIYDVRSEQQVRYLKNPSNATIGHVAWSPDGKWIAYADSSGIFIISPDGGTPHRVSEALGDIAFWIRIP